MNNIMRLIPLTAMLSAFFFAGCAAGGGGMTKQRGQAGMSACPSDRTLVNGECVPIGADTPAAGEQPRRGK